VFEQVEGGRAGEIGVARLDDPNGRRAISRLTCARVHFAGGRGLCLVPEAGAFKQSFTVKIFGARFKTLRKLDAAGIPSRARVSPDGRYGATTGFINGHSYTQDGFSTKTQIIDMASGKVIADLEQDFTVTRDGRRISAADFNFWGVTFARKSNRFYATLGTGGKTYLLEGDVPSRRARVIRENAECPAISPDNTRVAYKKRVHGRWRFHVLDLESGTETPLVDTNGVDDQVEWLDDEHILYAFSPPAAVWVIRADGGGSPRKFLAGGLSPAVVRDQERGTGVSKT
jgi:Tol biopolymer transport system component